MIVLTARALALLTALLLGGGAATQCENVLESVILARAPYPGKPCDVVFIGSQSAHALSALVSARYMNVSAFLKAHEYFSKFTPLCVHVVLSKVERALLTPGFARAVFKNASGLSLHLIFVEDTDLEIRIILSHRDLQKVGYKTGIAVENCAVWTSDGHDGPQRAERLQPLPSTRQLIGGRTLKVGMLSFEPYVIRGPRGDLLDVGVGSQMARAASDLFNFTSVISTERKSLNQLPNGTWTGTMFDLTEGDIDVFLAIAQTYERFPYVDESTYILAVQINFYSAQPEVSVKWEALLYPLDIEVWILTLIVFLVVVPVYWLHFRLAAGVTSKTSTVYNSVKIPLSALLQEAQDIPEEAKLLSVVFQFCTLVLCTAYCSNLISFLTYPQPETVPRTVKELAASLNKFQVGLCHYPGGAANVYFEQTGNPSSRKVAEKMVLEKSFLECAAHATALKRRVCICYDKTFEQLVAKNLTLQPSWRPVVQSEDNFVMAGGYVFFHKKSRYTAAFNEFVRAVRDTGIVQRWRQNVLEYNMRISRPWMAAIQKDAAPLAANLTTRLEAAVTTGVQAFSLDNFVLCFALFCMGVTLAILSFVVEMCLRSMKLV